MKKFKIYIAVSLKPLSNQNIITLTTVCVLSPCNHVTMCRITNENAFISIIYRCGWSAYIIYLHHFHGADAIFKRSSDIMK